MFPCWASVSIPSSAHPAPFLDIEGAYSACPEEDCLQCSSRFLLDFFQESPHVPDFITNLTVWIPVAATLVAEIETLIKVLDRLTKVRSCALSGATGEEETSVQEWEGIPASLSGALLDFLARQPLNRLRVRCLIFLPISTLVRILASASAVTFVEAVCMENARDRDWHVDHTSTVPMPESFRLKSLGGRSLGASILQDLLHPQLTEHIAHLQQLELLVNWMDYQHGRRVLHAAADRLEQVTLKCQSYHTDKPVILPLPPFPILQRFEFFLSIRDIEVSWFKDAILTLLTPALTPSLTKLVVRVRRESWDSQVNPTTNFLGALDGALIVHTASPSIHWEVNYRPVPFMAFQLRVEEYMRKSRELGRLFVENDPTPTPPARRAIFRAN
ncbi:hypothetical protein C8R47DRAFT_1151577 [Mycena vitilis]|nr:hypothetical protein C8R47DRAFT_1151577 [Mycena vitilis]